jgi:Putative beta barrel porin-7 (BBP7)
VNFTTRWIGLIMIVALASAASADDLFPVDPDGMSFPPEAMAPSSGGEELPPLTPPLEPITPSAPSRPSHGATNSVLTGPPQVAPDQEIPDEGFGDANPYDMYGGEPAVPISSGTWLNRGMWYGEADGLMGNRVWAKRDKFMASQDSNVTNLLFFRSLLLQGGGGTAQLPTNRNIFLKRGHPGEDATANVTLGRFLFRDDDNRDHAVEFTAEGGGDWNQDLVLTSSTPFNLFVPVITDGGNRSFQAGTTAGTGSSRQEVKYSNRLSNFELNYRVKRRLGRDQMVMDPNGNWRREASNGWTKDFLIGFRFMNLHDNMDWTANDIGVVGADGRYLIQTQNNLLGTQIGGGFGYETGRWSLGVENKLGLFINDASAASDLNFTADDTSDFHLHFHEDTLSFMDQTQLIGRWHLTPGFSLRAGLQLLFVSSQAVAPEQANFISTYSRLNTRNDPYYMGGSLGFEGYW